MATARKPSAFPDSRMLLRVQKRLIEQGKRMRLKAEKEGRPAERHVYSYMLRDAIECPICEERFFDPRPLVLWEANPILGHVAGNVFLVHRDCKSMREGDPTGEGLDARAARSTRRAVLRMWKGVGIRRKEG